MYGQLLQALLIPSTIIVLIIFLDKIPWLLYHKFSAIGSVSLFNPRDAILSSIVIDIVSIFSSFEGDFFEKTAFPVAFPYVLFLVHIQLFLLIELASYHESQGKRFPSYIVSLIALFTNAMTFQTLLKLNF